MLEGDKLAELEAAGIHQVIATAHGAEWAKVLDLTQERVVIGVNRRVVSEHVRVDWVVQNGHLVSGISKVREDCSGSFSEEQADLLRRVAEGKSVEREV